MTRTTTAPVTHSPGSCPQVGRTAPAPAIDSRGLRKTFGSLVAVDNLVTGRRANVRQLKASGRFELIEHDVTSNIFSKPSKQQTEDYITGRFG